MICKNCGFKNNYNDVTCANCGNQLIDNQVENIFGNDILIPIDNNLEKNKESNNSLENVELKNESNESIENINVEDNKVLETIQVVENSNDNLEGIVENVSSVQDLNNNLENVEVKNNENILPVENINNNENILPVENINNNTQNMFIEDNKVVKEKEPIDMKRILIIVGGMVLASLIILISVIIITSTMKKEYQGTTEKVVNTDYKISFNGYDIVIPSSLTYEVKTDSLIISDKNNTWMTVVQISDFNYSQLLVNKDKIKASYEKLQMKVSDMKEQKYNDVTFLTSEMTKLDTELVIGITKASTDQSFVVVSLNKDYKISYDGLKNVADILKNAKYTGINKTSNIKSDFFDFSGIKA